MLAPADWELVKNYLLGGASLGAGAAGVTALVNHLNDINSRKDDDADTLKLVVRGKPKQVKNAAPAVHAGAPASSNGTAPSGSMLRAPLAIVGGLLATGGGYALVHHLYQQFKKRELEQKLHDAQNQYVDVLDNEAGDKNAMVDRKGLSRGEMLSAIPLTTALLIALGSGTVANQALRKAFPPAKPGIQSLPQRVVVKREAAPDDDDEKMAADAVTSAVLGFNTRNNDVEDMIAAASMGRLKEMRNLAADFGVSMMLDAVKGAARESLGFTHCKIASKIMNRDPELGPTFRMLNAVTLVNQMEPFCKLASCIPDDLADNLVKLAVTGERIFCETVLLPEIANGVEISGEKNASSFKELMPAQEILESLIHE